MLVFDAHLDLSLNALEYNRDLRKTVSQIRQTEQGLTDLRGRGDNTVCFPEMREAGIGICVATLIGGCMKPPIPIACWNSPEQAWAMTQGQVAWYRAMETDGQMRQLLDWNGVAKHLESWNSDPDKTPIGYLLSLEGADSFRTLDDLDDAVTRHGLRALGPAHYGAGRYALGHDQSGPLSQKGKDLLHKMDEHDLILDATHLCDETFWGALEIYEGPVWASHHNCRALVDNPRQLADDQIKALAERDAVIGHAFDIWMIVAGWKRDQSKHKDFDCAGMEALADHIDHVAQLLGTTRHSGIGTDLDGGFGQSQSPADLDTIADLNKFCGILEKRGYSKEDLEGIFSGNFLRFLERALPLGPTI